MQIADEIDAVGQRLRLFRIVRGAILWTTFAILATAIAAGLAHFMREGEATVLVTALWIGCLLISAGWWIGRPLLMRPRPLHVARLVETRVSGLHNGLTNSLQLAEADDLQASPWLGVIFDEVLNSTRAKPLSGAVQFSQLKPIGATCAGAVALVIAIVLTAPAPFAHGWRQLFSPGAFVPKAGDARIIDVQPGDTTLVAGQPLEIVASVEAKPTDVAELVVNAARFPMTLQSSASPMRFAYRLEHVDESMRYRVEVGGTQSRLFKATVVKQIGLEQIQLRITPPNYTRQATKLITLKDDEIEKTPVTVLQGSKVEIDAAVDVSVGGAMIQLGSASPVSAKLLQEGRHVTGDFVVLDETPLSILVTSPTGQIVAALPASPLVIHCTPDAAPAIEMKWPTRDCDVAPDAEVKIAAVLRDDLGVASGRVMISGSSDEPMTVAREFAYPDSPTTQPLSLALDLKPEQRKHGQSIRVQVQATDTRDLSEHKAAAIGRGMSDDTLGPQTVSSPVFEIRFRDPAQIARESKEQSDKLRAILMEMLKTQRSLQETTVAWKTADDAGMKKIGAGQDDLRSLMHKTAETFDFPEADRIVQKTLQMLALNPAKEAVDLASAIPIEPVDKEKLKLASDLQSRQRRIISTLESLLAIIANTTEPTTQPNKNGGDLKNEADALKKLDEALKQYMAEQKKILDQTANLAKKPVDRFDDNDKKQLEDLAMAQEKLDAFMQEKIADFSKLAEQDMSNATLLRELMEIYSEVKMAADALKQKATEIATPAEENGLELAKEIESNLEKWLPDAPDRQQWKMEDPIDGKTDVPMAELPKELEDMVGELMEQQEDLFDEIEDANANYADSLDKGAGWDAMDGPIADMSAKGVTGNTLPNNNEMNGRAGEGRSGKSQGEMVEDTATGKGGRNTPTRLDPTPFQQGQIKDTSKDPVGGATGGGKLSGQSGEGLEGPVPPQITKEMQRLAQKQAQLRNTAERLNLQYKLGRYDNFKLLESTALMRRIEADLNANRYVNALRRRDVTLDALDTSHLLLGGEVHVQQDTTPAVSTKLQNEINDAMKGNLPPAWSEALKEYYRKLGEE
jgi:hypothetical protein